MSLRLRLAAVMGLLFFAGMVALYLAAEGYARLAADRSYDRLLSGSALSILETVSLVDGSVQADIPYAALDMLSAAPNDRVFYGVIGADGKTVTGYRDLPAPPQRSRPRMRGEDAPGLTSFFDAGYRGDPVRFVRIGREIAQPGKTGFVWVQVGQTREARESFASELVVATLVPIVLMTLLALLAVWFGIVHALRPLRAIGDELSARQPSDLHPIAAPVPAEVAPLVASINGFMLRLRGNIDALRAFIGDAAHQLRTPLAALLAQAQLAADDDPRELRHSLSAIERNANKLIRLVNQLLSDATVHHLSAVRRFESFDLIEVLQQAIRESVPVSEDSDVRFTTSLGEAHFVGDALIMGEVVKNLVHNALRHGRGENGEVTIDLALVEETYLLTVRDRGPGIPAEDRERVFERFTRGTSTAPGAGLGLAIVRDAVASQGGNVRLLERPGGGLEVEISLPRSPQ